MAFVRDGNLLMIGDQSQLGSHRIEPGPALLTAKATEEILADEITATHYQPPRPATQEEIDAPHILTEDDQRLFLDAKGVPIRLGDDFHYLDWVGFQADEPKRVFYLYRLGELTAAEIKERELLPADPKTVWREIGVFETEEAAISVALDG